MSDAALAESRRRRLARSATPAAETRRVVGDARPRRSAIRPVVHHSSSRSMNASSVVQSGASVQTREKRAADALEARAGVEQADEARPASRRSWRRAAAGCPCRRRRRWCAGRRPSGRRRRSSDRRSARASRSPRAASERKPSTRYGSRARASCSARSSWPWPPRCWAWRARWASRRVARPEQRDLLLHGSELSWASAGGRGL